MGARCEHPGPPRARSPGRIRGDVVRSGPGTRQAGRGRRRYGRRRGGRRGGPAAVPGGGGAPAGGGEGAAGVAGGGHGGGGGAGSCRAGEKVPSARATGGRGRRLVFKAVGRAGNGPPNNLFKPCVWLLKGLLHLLEFRSELQAFLSTLLSLPSPPRSSQVQPLLLVPLDEAPSVRPTFASLPLPVLTRLRRPLPVRRCTTRAPPSAWPRCAAWRCCATWTAA